MALPDQKLVVPRHYRHIGLRRPCRFLSVNDMKLATRVGATGIRLASGMSLTGVMSSRRTAS